MSWPRVGNMRSCRRLGLVLATVLLLSQVTGCAAFTGLVTGAFTGAVDAPAQVYRENRGEFHRHPEYWPFNVFFFVPVGLAAGPICGFAKGLALDIDCVILNRTTYSHAFGSYKEPSVWSPYTIHW